ncbi:His-Xaa-Ser system radical SAM maturase HxsC [Roseateles sp. DB2]|uniref:His-Xaa-Ser system radical SAM maturase HxsC n=1 Tax=Roseateles sp. DB2 TaxID=3453717 RepID=UPI003EEE598D
MRQVQLATEARASGIYRVDQQCRDVAQLCGSSSASAGSIEVRTPRAGEAAGELRSFEVGDIVKLMPGSTRVIVCFRPSDRHHTLFVTNQCNSRCLMCSQPPTPQGDDWLFDEALRIVELVTEPPDVVGITGGEPTLHPTRLRALLNAIHSLWPETKVEVLTNGRRLGDDQVAETLLRGLPPGRTTWLVPLYAGNDEVHDFVVQSAGAFDETLAGLLNLQQYGQGIQLRSVMVRPVIDHLEQWATFIGHNLPFVQAVALMATEPIGFALANQEATLVDVTEYAHQLTTAVRILLRSQMRPVLMNMPLCKVPEPLRRYAARSISDWKNEYTPACDGCALKERCAGFFVWDKTSIYRTGIKPVTVQVRGGAHV